DREVVGSRALRHGQAFGCVGRPGPGAPQKTTRHADHQTPRRHFVHRATSTTRPPLARATLAAICAPMAAQYIFQMQGLSKTYPGGKKVFENIWLSFYPDAKIGVVGVNGSGKSTLLKIMAGIDKEFAGEARAADGTK